MYAYIHTQTLKNVLFLAVFTVPLGQALHEHITHSYTKNMYNN